MLASTRRQILGYGGLGSALALVVPLLGWVLLSHLLTHGVLSPTEEHHPDNPWLLGLHILSDLLIGLS